MKKKGIRAWVLFVWSKPTQFNSIGWGQNGWTTSKAEAENWEAREPYCGEWFKALPIFLPFPPKHKGGKP